MIFGIGPAGTGKTYLAMAKAVQALQQKEVSRIILTRPAVEAGERLGFLPGTLSDKIDPYLRPLYDALHDMMDPESIPRLMAAGTIEVAPLAYMRGRTLNDAFIILDEAQNTTPEQMKMFLTRLGFGSKMVVTGDVTQVDLPFGTRSRAADRARRSCRASRTSTSPCWTPRTWSGTGWSATSSTPTASGTRVRARRESSAGHPRTGRAAERDKPAEGEHEHRGQQRDRRRRRRSRAGRGCPGSSSNGSSSTRRPNCPSCWWTSRAMEKLHIELMDEPGATDVLSVPMDELRRPAPPDEARRRRGCSATSRSAPRWPRCRRRTPDTGMQDEMLLLTTHGILHLLGFDHAEPEEKEEMFGLQRQLLTAFTGKEAPPRRRSGPDMLGSCRHGAGFLTLLPRC